MKNETIQISEKLSFVVAPEVSQVEVIMTMADKYHWVTPQIIRDGGMIETPVTNGKWRFEPLIDHSIIPLSARKRIDLILKSIPVQGFIIGHEIEIETQPKIKPLPWVVAPEPEVRPWLPAPRNPEWEIDWAKVGHIAWSVTKVIGAVLLGALAILAMCLGAVVSCGTDPVIICVTEAGQWVEIYRYYS